MESKSVMLPKDQQIYKTQPINVDFIKKEKIEDEECFVVQGIVESMEVDQDSVKEEVFKGEEISRCSTSNV